MRKIKKILDPKYVVILVAVVAVGWITTMVISGSSGTTSGFSASYLHYFTAEDRLNNSDRVIRAEYIGEDDYSRPIISPVTNQAVGQIDGVFREYVILESFMGDGLVGETVYVSSAFNVLLDRPQGDVTLESKIVFPTVGTEYVLFLKSRTALETDPPKIGDTRWSHVGEPGIAELIGRKLRFLATEPYLDAVRVRNEEPAVPGSAAPFTMTLDELRALKFATPVVPTVIIEPIDGS